MPRQQPPDFQDPRWPAIVVSGAQDSAAKRILQKAGFDVYANGPTDPEHMGWVFIFGTEAGASPQREAEVAASLLRRHGFDYVEVGDWDVPV